MDKVEAMLQEFLKFYSKLYKSTIPSTLKMKEFFKDKTAIPKLTRGAILSYLVSKPYDLHIWRG